MTRILLRSGGRTVVAAFTAVAAVALTTAASTAAVRTPSDLGAPTSTATQHREATGQSTLVGVRVGRHLDYDRMVFDLTGALPGWTVGYVRRLTADPSGRPVALRGPAVLRVALAGAQAHDEYGSSTLRTPSTMTPEFPTLRQVRQAGDFEGIVSFGLGLRDRVGFRVFGLANPTRVVVDVAHQPRQPFGTSAVDRAGSAGGVIVTDLRTGRHPGYDRAVFTVAGSAHPSLRVAYLGTGSTIEVSVLAVGSARSAPHATYSGPSLGRTGLTALQQAALSSTGAGTLGFHLGTAARHGFRVIVLDAPNRIVVDVAH